MGSVVLDTSVLLGLLDPLDAHHPAADRALREERGSGQQLVLPVTALAEALVGASRLGPGAVQTVEAFVDGIVDRVHDIDRDVARAAARCRATHRFLRLPDALVIAVGLVLGADRVLTADERWTRVDGRVRLIE